MVKQALIVAEFAHHALHVMMEFKTRVKQVLIVVAHAVHVLLLHHLLHHHHPEMKPFYMVHILKQDGMAILMEAQM
jgi:hypothetical protein